MCVLCTPRAQVGTRCKQLCGALSALLYSTGLKKTLRKTNLITRKKQKRATKKKEKPKRQMSKDDIHRERATNDGITQGSGDQIETGCSRNARRGRTHESFFPHPAS
eukprot:1563275-Pleurochrysis_carterae.AAC.2